MVLRLGFKEFLSACVKKFTVYIWSLATKKNFLRHQEIIAKKTGVRLPSSRIVDQSFYFRNDHFLPEKPNKLVFHKNLFKFFAQFASTTFENILLIDNMPHKSLFNPPFTAIFFLAFYRSHNDVNYLLQTIILYLESLHSFKMQVYKFIKLNPFGSITDLLIDNLWYAKLIVSCFTKCDETFCNRVKSRSLNKRDELFYLFIMELLCMDGLLP